VNLYFILSILDIFGFSHAKKKKKVIGSNVIKKKRPEN